MKECYDHLGNKFKSLTDLCKAYNITRYNYRDRKNQGWTLEEILTTDLNMHQRLHYKNNELIKRHRKNNELIQICEKNNLSVDTVKSRLQKEVPYDIAISQKPIPRGANSKKSQTDHKGNKFDSIKEMCKFWNIEYHTFVRRIGYGKTIEEALTTPVKQRRKQSDHIYDIFGNEFTSMVDIDKCYHLPAGTYKQRIQRSNARPSQALNIVPMPYELNRIADSNYYLLKTEDYGEVVVTFETLEKYYISKFDQSKLDKSYMINDNEELDKEAI